MNYLFVKNLYYINNTPPYTITILLFKLFTYRPSS
jgi:hypothetical protein